MNYEYKKQVLKIVGGRFAARPQWTVPRLEPWPSKHLMVFRTSKGIVFWFEVWCDHESVIGAKIDEAKKLATRGFRVAFLPTTFSVRDVGRRRPLLATPIESQVDLSEICERLQEARYVGPKVEDGQ